MAAVHLFVTFSLSFLLDCVQAGEYCWVSGYTYFDYCPNGCCSGQCCALYSYGALVGIIVGSVVGGLMFIASVIALICCCVSKKTHSGRVVQPASLTGNVTVVSSGSQSNQAWPPQPGPSVGYGVQYNLQYGPQYGLQYEAQFSGPPPYQPPEAPPVTKGGAIPPPPPSYSDPAYPPTGRPA